MTAFPHLELAIEAINEARVEIFLTKPMDPDKLIGVIQDTLRSRKRPSA
jgi:response regulator RpfG family c-di-GMP phosphodiesterase